VPRVSRFIKKKLRQNRKSWIYIKLGWGESCTSSTDLLASSLPSQDVKNVNRIETVLNTKYFL